MRKPTLLLLLAASIALPTYAARGRDQSYITFDSGGGVVKQGEDGSEVEARVNLPIYPGDEISTGRRGRTEIRLSDGNVIALDRSTSLRLRSIQNSYEGDSTQTVLELKYGRVAMLRTDLATDVVRLDTPNASYAATEEDAAYSVDSDSRGHDRVVVYGGSIEVRTPAKTTRLQRREEARVDDQGLYGLVRTSAGDDFERWFIQRTERYTGVASRYLDRSLSYAERDLQDHGDWVYLNGFNSWGWRPHVSTVDWRPFYNGSWGYGYGCLTWISYEPWGWVTSHYGRWAYDYSYGWVWCPGYTYSPAWVYWAYGPGYVGWAPSGWYDCYRPYYGWAYRPYQRAGFDFGFGFYGNVRMNEVDLRPWTFVNPNSIVSTRVDQAALTTDAIRQRIIREPSAGIATVSGTPARFSRVDLKDPAAAVSSIARRGLVGGTGKEGSGRAADITPFFRRDPELSNTVRDRISRSRALEPVAAIGAGAPSGVPTPGTNGTIEGRVTRDGGGSRGDNRFGGVDRGGALRDGLHDSTPSNRAPANGGAVRRETTAPEQSRETTAPERSGNWRERIERTPATPPASNERQRLERGGGSGSEQRMSGEAWRGRAVQRGERAPAAEESGSSSRSSGSDVPRRVIDRIGGARIYSGESSRESPREYSRESSRESSRGESERPRSTYNPPPSTERYSPPPSRIERSSPPPQSQERSAPPPERVERSSPPPQQQQQSSPPPSRSNSDGGGGRVHRDRDH